MSEPERKQSPVSESEAQAALARARARIGRTLPPVRFLIDRSDLRRYAQACGETWAPYLQGDVATPTFVSALQTEGMRGDLFERDLPFVSMLHSDDAVDLFATIHPGDVLIGTASYRDAKLKMGRRGPMLFQTAELNLCNEAGQVVACVASSIVSF